MLHKYLNKTVYFPLKEGEGPEIVLIPIFRKAIFQLNLGMVVFVNEAKFIQIQVSFTLQRDFSSDLCIT